MRTDSLGLPIFDHQDAVDLIYQNRLAVLQDLQFEPHKEIEIYNESVKLTGVGETFDIESHIISITPVGCEQRVQEELAAFKQHGYLNLLKFLHYLVQNMRSSNMLWGVGRGSSVASYVLYLLGVHRIDSIQYGLDWREFLR